MDMENNILKIMIITKGIMQKESFMEKVNLSIYLGLYKWHTGASYSGQFKFGQRNGHGIWQSSALGGDVYEGEY